MNTKLWNTFPIPSLKEDYSVFVNRKYYIRYVSVFDHWLSQELAAEDIILYQEDFGDDVESQKKYQKHEALLLNFYSYLYDKAHSSSKCNR